MVETKVIRRKNGMLLVEWLDRDVPKRAWVKPEMVVEDRDSVVVVDNPDAGIPYGVEFWRLITLSATPQAVDRELKQRGIWTIEDLRNNPAVVVGTLQAVYGVDLAALYAAVSKYERDINGG